MRAVDLLEGMIVKTTRGQKMVRSSTLVSKMLQRIAFTDGDICLCPPSLEYQISKREKNESHEKTNQ